MPSTGKIQGGKKRLTGGNYEKEKFMSIVLAAAMAVSIAGCGSSSTRPTGRIHRQGELQGS